MFSNFGREKIELLKVSGGKKINFSTVHISSRVFISQLLVFPQSFLHSLSCLTTAFFIFVMRTGERLTGNEMNDPHEICIQE